MTARLPSARRPGWRWYVAMARLVGARVLERATPAGFGRVLRLLSLVLGLRLLATVDVLFPIGGHTHPRQAIYQWVVQLIILIISAIISAAMTPKPKTPDPVTANTPTVEDGKGMDIVCGTVWIEDETVLGFKEVGTQKIKAQGGKKG